ncbi:MAG: oligogalacturonate lyase family protein [Candidatus Dactylopiibacterium sp.]|nr:oligogalacturonate lyase family protein [Candidatus Dactylopiibacterium sp.]
MKRFLCATLLIAPALALATKGERFAAESRIVADEDGYTVTQLTTHPADDAVLYFTNAAVSPADEMLVFTSRRTGYWNLYGLDLRSHGIVQLTDSKRLSGTGAVVAPVSREVFYKDGRQIKALSLQTLEERVVTDLLPGFIVSAAVTASPDGKVVAVSQVEDIPVSTRTDVIYSDMDERFEKRPFSQIYTGNGDGSDWHTVAGQKKWISHVLLSPTAPHTLLYCHEGHWARVEQRMWLIGRDDRGNRLLREEETPALSIGHEYFFPDGVHVGYHGNYAPPDRRPFIGVADIRDGSYREYPTPTGNTHTQANAAGTLFVGDGNARAPSINVYALREGRLETRLQYRHDGSWAKQDWHPHPSFLPDGGIVFTSNRGGDGNVYLLRMK